MPDKFQSGDDFGNRLTRPPEHTHVQVGELFVTSQELSPFY